MCHCVDHLSHKQSTQVHKTTLRLFFNSFVSLKTLALPRWQMMALEKSFLRSSGCFEQINCRTKALSEEHAARCVLPSGPLKILKVCRARLMWLMSRMGTARQFRSVDWQVLLQRRLSGRSGLETKRMWWRRRLTWWEFYWCCICVKTTECIFLHQTTKKKLGHTWAANPTCLSKD